MLTIRQLNVMTHICGSLDVCMHADASSSAFCQAKLKEFLALMPRDALAAAKEQVADGV
jgi:hypothetical protein